MIKRIPEIKEVASVEVTYDFEVYPNGDVRRRRCTKDFDVDGNLVKQLYNSHVYHAGDDYSNEPQEVKDVCDVEHTQEKIQERKDFVAAMEAKLNG